MPGRERDEELSRSISEAVRNTLNTMKEERTMQATTSGGQTLLGDDIGAIVNIVTPVVAAVLQSRAQQQPYGNQFSPIGFAQQGPQQGWLGGQQWWGQGAFGQRGLHEEVALIVGAVLPAVLPALQSRAQQMQQPFFQQQLPYFQQQPYFQPFQSQAGWGVHPGEIAQIVTPIVTSLLQSRSYQGHFGQTMPRAA
jgi:hypothetical protein